MIRKADKSDLHTLGNLAIRLWKNHTADDLADEFETIMEKEDAQFFIKYCDNEPIGFVQCQLRHDYVEGTESSPVGYLEGIFIREEYRHKGYAKELLQQCEKWAASMGCTEFASDCELDNTDSFQFHKSMGFEEVNRVICFTKRINHDK